MAIAVAIAIYMAIAGTLVTSASLGGQQATLCSALGGTYTPGAGDVCPDGQWPALPVAAPRK